jgi:tyrosine-protein kinase
VDLRRQITIVRTWLPLLVASALLAAGAAFVASNLQGKTYEAKAKLIVGEALSTSPDYYQLLVSRSLSTVYALAATSTPRLQAVIAELGLTDTVDELAQRVQAEAPADSPLLTISVEDSDPKRAAAIANALAAQAVKASADQGQGQEFDASIAADLKATQDQIRTTQARVQTLAGLASPSPEQQAELGTLEGRLVSLRSTYATLLSLLSGRAANLLSDFESAVPPTSPISPRPLLNTLIAAIVGLLIAGVLVGVLEYLDDSIKTREDIQEVAGLNTLGSIERMKGNREPMYRLAALLYPRSATA